MSTKDQNEPKGIRCGDLNAMLARDRERAQEDLLLSAAFAIHLARELSFSSLTHVIQPIDLGKALDDGDIAVVEKFNAACSALIDGEKMLRALLVKKEKERQRRIADLRKKEKPD